MTMGQAIKKAIQAGWFTERKGTRKSIKKDGSTYWETAIRLAKEQIELFLDPRIWQSLGKPLGWGTMHEPAKWTEDHPDQ